jgi:hypothetical protein
LDIERLVGDNLLQSTVLIFQSLELLSFGDFQASVFGLPLVKSLLADAKIPTNVLDLLARFLALQSLDNLFFRETTLLHIDLLDVLSGTGDSTNHWRNLTGYPRQDEPRRPSPSAMERKFIFSEVLFVRLRLSRLPSKDGF